MASIIDFPLRPYVSPARVVAGPNATARAGGELADLGISPESGKVLVIADAALIKLGLTVPVIESLRTAGFTLIEARGVAAEPTPATVEHLLAAIGEGTVAAVVGIGGGSAIDASKLVAAAVNNPVPLTVGLGPMATLRDVPPIMAVPSTAGTGAEATAVAMLWHESHKRIFVHPLLVPRTAILDPDLLSGLPRAVAAASGLDALSHAVESMLSTFRTPLTREVARSAVRHLAPSLASEFEATNPAGRQLMSLGAYEAGLSLNASVVIGHSLAYTIASRTGLSHGVTCAMALPYCLAYNRQVSEDVLAEIGMLVGVGADGEALLDWLVDLTASLQIPSNLEEVGIAHAGLAEMAEECCTTYPRPNNPRPLTPEDVDALLEHFHSGDIKTAWRESAEARA